MVVGGEGERHWLLHTQQLCVGGGGACVLAHACMHVLHSARTTAHAAAREGNGREAAQHCKPPASSMCSFLVVVVGRRCGSSSAATDVMRQCSASGACLRLVGAARLAARAHLLLCCTR